MCKNKIDHSNNEKDNKMKKTITVNDFSLTEFIKANSARIHSITPRNPTIKKNDEWRDEDFWDDLCRKKTKK